MNLLDTDGLSSKDLAEIDFFVAQLISGSPVIPPQWATANREKQGALIESRTTIAGDPFYREWLCGTGRAVRVVYWSAFTSITAYL